jgi:hypothetical protein
VETQKIIEQAQMWVDYYTQVQAQRQLVRLAAERALDGFKAALLPVRVGGPAQPPGLAAMLTGEADKNIAWRVLLLGPGDIAGLTAIAHYVSMAPIDDDVREQLGQLSDAVPEALADLAAAKRMMASAKVKEAAAEATDFLTEYVEWGTDEGIVAAIKSLEPNPEPTGITAADAITPTVGFAAIWRSLGAAALIETPKLNPGAIADTAAADIKALRSAIAAKNPTHLLVMSAPDKAVSGLLKALGT